MSITSIFTAIVLFLIHSNQVRELEKWEEVHGLGNSATLTCEKLEFLNDFFEMDSESSNDCIPEKEVSFDRPKVSEAMQPIAIFLLLAGIAGSTFSVVKKNNPAEKNRKR